MARYDRFDLYNMNYVLSHECTVYAFDAEAEENIEFCFSTRAEYDSGIEEFERRTYETYIFRYTVFKRTDAKYVFDADGDATGTVRLYVLNFLSDIAEDMGV